MESNDPFGSIVEHCHVSSSQEDRFNRCRFAGEPVELLSSADEPAEIQVESTGIMLVSLPETSEDIGIDNNTPHDIFQTPPEESFSISVDHRDDNQTVDGTRDGEDDDGAAAVDLGRDTDLGFSEVELTQRIESEEIQSESEKVRVLKRESPINEEISESPSKRSKISGLETPATEISRERLVKSMEKLKFKVASPYNYGAKSPQNDQSNENCEEESITKRKLNFSTEVLESQIEENNKEGNSVTKSVEDIDKFRYVGGNVNMERKFKGLRALPVSIQGPVEDSGGDLEAEKNCREVTLLDVLKLLARDCEYGGLKGVSVLDVAKRRGMTFPRPSWWPEEGFKVVDD